MMVPVGPVAEGARWATGASGLSATLRAPTPDPEVPAKVQRRRFTAEYRLRLLREADACKKPGALGALLRREGLYSSHLANWRRGSIGMRCGSVIDPNFLNARGMTQMLRQTAVLSPTLDAIEVRDINCLEPKEPQLATRHFERIGTCGQRRYKRPVVRPVAAHGANRLPMTHIDDGNDLHALP